MLQSGKPQGGEIFIVPGMANLFSSSVGAECKLFRSYRAKNKGLSAIYKHLAPNGALAYDNFIAASQIINRSL
jgi:hypothetical protein